MLKLNWLLIRGISCTIVACNSNYLNLGQQGERIDARPLDNGREHLLKMKLFCVWEITLAGSWYEKLTLKYRHFPFRLRLFEYKMIFECKIFLGENIFGKEKYFQTFDCIIKIVLGKYFYVFVCIMKMLFSHIFFQPLS